MNIYSEDVQYMLEYNHSHLNCKLPYSLPVLLDLMRASAILDIRIYCDHTSRIITGLNRFSLFVQNFDYSIIY